MYIALINKYFCSISDERQMANFLILLYLLFYTLRVLVFQMKTIIRLLVCDEKMISLPSAMHPVIIPQNSKGVDEDKS